MKKLLLLIVLTFVLSSCFPAYKIQPKADRSYKLEDNYTNQKVYVINSDSLEQEFKILKYSELYNFTADSTNTTKIKLYPLERTSFFCGNSMMLSAVTLGLMPSQFRDTFNYKFDVLENNTIEQKVVELKVSQNLWLFNIFSNKKKFKKQAGIALRAQLGQ